jgi:hypothetical protein
VYSCWLRELAPEIRIALTIRLMVALFSFSFVPILRTGVGCCRERDWNEMLVSSKKLLLLQLRELVDKMEDDPVESLRRIGEEEVDESTETTSSTAASAFSSFVGWVNK